MTDKRPDALRLAALLEKTGAQGSLRDEAASELRRQHDELETLRAKLKTYEDLGDAGSDVQLLRMGYAAARLEIESLKAQLHAAKQINTAQFWLLTSSIPGSALRASHWQAPAQAAAPAQAGEYPALVCDYCGALTPDPWHSSGMLHGKMSKHIHSCDACCRGAAQAAPAYKDSTPELHVGDSAFESWYSTYSPAHKSDKQRARDTYAAGMGDPLVTAAPAGESLRTDALCDLSYSHGLKAGWNYCASDDLAGFERAQKIGTEALRTLKSTTAQAAPTSVLQLVHSAFAEIAMAFPKAFALHKVGIADTAVREALAAPAPAAVAGPSWEALHHAWMKIGADVAGLDWGAFTNAVHYAPTTQPAPQQSGVGNSGFDHKTAADFLAGKTVSDEAARKFVASSRWAHDDRAGFQATLLSVRHELASREAEITLLKTVLMNAEAAAKQGGAA